MPPLPQPLIPGFNPDPSIVVVDGTYYVATSTFEYLPGIPIYRSTDLHQWDLIGHVATRPGQLGIDGVPTGGGAWAPTIRWRDGLFHLVVTDAFGRGTLHFTAADPAGPWSDGTVLELNGIDPDLAWDDDGTAIITFSGLQFNPTKHLGIQQVRVDLATGRALEEVRSIWSGTGLMFPEAPHLYDIDGSWYLVLAEGGTERGHTVSVARSASPYGPFEGCPANPVLSARSTDRPIQNTGHGDLFRAVDGSWHMVLLGMRVRGMTRSFAALGRETFSTPVDWIQEWPIPQPVLLPAALSDMNAPSFVDDFSTDELGLEWIGVRRRPVDVVASVGAGELVLVGEGRTMDHLTPTFVGRRQRRHDARIEAVIADSGAVGGLTVRYDEQSHFDIEVRGGEVIARVCVPGIRQEHTAAFSEGTTTLFMEMQPVLLDRPPFGDENMVDRMTCDHITMGVVTSDGRRIDLARVDGRSLSAETACSFTGRVVGLYCVEGRLIAHRYSETGLG